MSDKEEIIRLLPRLTVVELRDCKARVDFLLQASVLGDQRKGVTTTDEDWIERGIIEVLKSRGMMAPPTMFAETKFKRRAARVQQYLLLRVGSPCGRPLLSAQKLALGVRCAAALAELVGVWVTVSPRTMIQNVDKIPEALERSFPGYLGGGMIGLLIGLKVTLPARKEGEE